MSCNISSIEPMYWDSKFLLLQCLKCCRTNCSKDEWKGKTWTFTVKGFCGYFILDEPPFCCNWLGCNKKSVSTILSFKWFIYRRKRKSVVWYVVSLFFSLEISLLWTEKNKNKSPGHKWSPVTASCLGFLCSCSGSHDFRRQTLPSHFLSQIKWHEWVLLKLASSHTGLFMTLRPWPRGKFHFL